MCSSAGSAEAPGQIASPADNGDPHSFSGRGKPVSASSRCGRNIAGALSERHRMCRSAMHAFSHPGSAGSSQDRDAAGLKRGLGLGQWGFAVRGLADWLPADRSGLARSRPGKAECHATKRRRFQDLDISATLLVSSPKQRIGQFISGALYL